MIELNNIGFHYSSGKEVFRNLNLKMQKGEKIGLVGSNGAGKTTLFYLIMGLLKPSSGEVRIFGRERKKEKDFAEVRQKLGLLFQDSDDQLFCPTVEEDIAFGPLNLGRSHHEAQHIVEDTCAMLGLGGFEKKITHRLSGGEKRLVALATVVAMSPECFLLDEPTAGLDEETTKRVLSYLGEHADTCMIISHDHEFLVNAVDRLYTLRDGEIVPAGK